VIRNFGTKKEAVSKNH